MARNLKRVLTEWGTGGFLKKADFSKNLRATLFNNYRTYQMNLISAESMSLDSTFNETNYGVLHPPLAH
jgi:hypothetical protein